MTAAATTNGHGQAMQTTKDDEIADEVVDLPAQS
jgi:hypothetical protein